MKTFLDRLKSPVVIIQIIVTIGALFVIFEPSYSETVKEIVAILTAMINVFAGLNNPTDKENF